MITDSSDRWTCHIAHALTHCGVLCHDNSDMHVYCTTDTCALAFHPLQPVPACVSCADTISCGHGSPGRHAARQMACMPDRSRYTRLSARGAQTAGSWGRVPDSLVVARYSIATPLVPSQVRLIRVCITHAQQEITSNVRAQVKRQPICSRPGYGPGHVPARQLLTHAALQAYMPCLLECGDQVCEDQCEAWSASEKQAMLARERCICSNAALAAAAAASQ